MKTNVLERYSRKPDGHYVIDITAGKVGDLYNDFDKNTPYVRKELDQNLVEYITESARDLGKERFLIQFNLLVPADEELKARIVKSINSYFLYLKTIEINELARVMRISMIYFLVGMTLLFLTVWVNEQLSTDSSVISEVFAKGLTVAAWVALWEALATLLINWTPFRRQIKMYEQIAEAPVRFI